MCLLCFSLQAQPSISDMQFLEFPVRSDDLWLRPGFPKFAQTCENPGLQKRLPPADRFRSHGRNKNRSRGPHPAAASSKHADLALCMLEARVEGRTWT